MSQQLPEPGYIGVTEALIEHVLERQQKGIATYGRSLETFNGRSSVLDALEESLDLSQYLMQLRMELGVIRDHLRYFLDDWIAGEPRPSDVYAVIDRLKTMIGEKGA